MSYLLQTGVRDAEAGDAEVEVAALKLAEQGLEVPAVSRLLWQLVAQLSVVVLSQLGPTHKLLNEGSHSLHRETWAKETIFIIRWFFTVHRATL